MADEPIFDEQDVSLLSRAICMYPNLEIACYAAKLATEMLQFPVESHDAMHPLFDADVPERIGARQLDPSHVEKFFPKEFLPIEDADDLIGKVLAALSWGDIVHHHEAAANDPTRTLATQLYPPFGEQ